MLVTPYVPWKLNRLMAPTWPALNVHNELVDFIYNLKISTLNLFTIGQEVRDKMTEDQRVAFDAMEKLVKELNEEDVLEDYIDVKGKSYDYLFYVEGYDDSMEVEYIGRDLDELSNASNTNVGQNYVNMDDTYG
jgi:hypothetical protein